MEVSMTGRSGVAVITGGGTGMGLASAQALAGASFDLLIAGRRPQVLANARKAITDAHPERAVVTLSADVGIPDQALRIVGRAVAELGALDVMVTAAAAYDPVPLLEMTVEQWDRTINVALRGTFVCAVAAARHMKDHGGGRVILFGSTDSVESEPEVAHYNAAKAGVKSLAHSMAVEFAPHGISVNAIGPGWVRTPMVEEFLSQATPESLRHVNPLGRWADPSEIANLVRYLATDAPPFLTGALIMIDGGQTIMAPMP
jgi:NAD(P)-dependent dehydrogenase (short-subunit alcohol dehydrogenase family)